MEEGRVPSELERVVVEEEEEGIVGSLEHMLDMVDNRDSISYRGEAMIRSGDRRMESMDVKDMMKSSEREEVCLDLDSVVDLRRRRRRRGRMVIRMIA